MNKMNRETATKEPWKHSKFRLIAVILGVLFAATMVFFATKYWHVFEGTTEPQLAQTADKEETRKSISIPGYEGIRLKAGKKKQDVRLKNPSQNTCYFVMSLYLEDGTLLWQSELVKPGEESKPIKLIKPLDAGTYSNSILQYSCFAMDENLAPLNGAETKLALRVK